MSDSIRVHAVKYGGRKNLMMRSKDPSTGKQIATSTGTTKRREAECIALKWEAELLVIHYFSLLAQGVRFNGYDL